MRVRRLGSMFLEVGIATLVLAAALVAISQVLAVTAQQRRAVDQRRLAIGEAANLLEQVVALPWEDVNADRVAALTLSAHAARLLPDGRVGLDELARPVRPRARDRLRPAQ